MQPAASDRLLTVCQRDRRVSRVASSAGGWPGEIAETAPDRAAEIIAARLNGLRANMTATLGAMKAAAESLAG